MTLSLNNPVLAGPIGPGYTMRWASSIPTGATDIMRVTLSDAGGVPVLSGDAPAAGALTGKVVIGKATPALQVAFPYQKAVVAGNTVSILLEQLNAGGMFIAGYLPTGPYTYDPTGALGHLMALLFGSTSGTILDEILAAVRQTWT